MERQAFNSLNEAALQVQLGDTTQELEINEVALEYFESYFDGDLNEDTSDEDIIDAVYGLVGLTEAVMEAVDLNELLAATPRRRKAVAKRRATDAGISRGWNLPGEPPAFSPISDKTPTPPAINRKRAEAKPKDELIRKKTERGFTRAANDPKLSPKFKEKLNRIATRRRTEVIKMRPQVHGGDSWRRGELPQHDYRPARAEIKAGRHKTPQTPQQGT